MWAVALLQKFIVDFGYFPNTGARATTVELRVTPSRLVPLPKAVADITFFPAFEGVCLARMDDHCQAGYEDSPRARAKSVFDNGCPCYCCRHINFTESEHRTFDYGPYKKELVHEKSEVVASNDDHLWARISLLCKRRLC